MSHHRPIGRAIAATLVCTVATTTTGHVPARAADCADCLPDVDPPPPAPSPSLPHVDDQTVVELWSSDGQALGLAWTSSMGAWGADDQLVAMDVDGDGRDDLVRRRDAGDAVTEVWRSTPTGLELLSTGTTGGWDGAPVVALDVDGDGRDDLAVLHDPGQGYDVEVWRSDGTGLGSPHTSWLPGPYQRVQAGDVNGDGRDDLVLSNDDQDCLVVGWGNPDSSFTERSACLPAIQSRPNTWTRWAVFLIDVNGDGRDEIVRSQLSSTADGDVWTFEQKSGKYLRPPPPDFYYKGTSPHRFPLWATSYTVDFDGDHRDDVVWLGSGNTRQDRTAGLQLTRPSTATYTPTVSYLSTRFGWGDRGHPALRELLGDFDGDGRADVVRAKHEVGFIPRDRWFDETLAELLQVPLETLDASFTGWRRLPSRHGTLMRAWRSGTHLVVATLNPGGLLIGVDRMVVAMPGFPAVPAGPTVQLRKPDGTTIDVEDIDCWDAAGVDAALAEMDLRGHLQSLADRTAAAGTTLAPAVALALQQAADLGDDQVVADASVSLQGLTAALSLTEVSIAQDLVRSYVGVAARGHGPSGYWSLWQQANQADFETTAAAALAGLTTTVTDMVTAFAPATDGSGFDPLAVVDRSSRDAADILERESVDALVEPPAVATDQARDATAHGELWAVVGQSGFAMPAWSDYDQLDVAPRSADAVDAVAWTGAWGLPELLDGWPSIYPRSAELRPTWSTKLDATGAVAQALGARGQAAGGQGFDFERMTWSARIQGEVARSMATLETWPGTWHELGNGSSARLDYWEEIPVVTAFNPDGVLYVFDGAAMPLHGYTTSPMAAEPPVPPISTTSNPIAAMGVLATQAGEMLASQAIAFGEWQAGNPTVIPDYAAATYYALRLVGLDAVTQMVPADAPGSVRNFVAFAYLDPATGLTALLGALRDRFEDQSQGFVDMWLGPTWAPQFTGLPVLLDSVAREASVANWWSESPSQLNYVKQYVYATIDQNFGSVGVLRARLEAELVQNFTKAMLRLEDHDPALANLRDLAGTAVTDWRAFLEAHPPHLLLHLLLPILKNHAAEYADLLALMSATLSSGQLVELLDWLLKRDALIPDWLASYAAGLWSISIDAARDRLTRLLQRVHGAVLPTFPTLVRWMLEWLRWLRQMPNVWPPPSVSNPPPPPPPPPPPLDVNTGEIETASPNDLFDVTNDLNTLLGYDPYPAECLADDCYGVDLWQPDPLPDITGAGFMPTHPIWVDGCRDADVCLQ